MFVDAVTPAEALAARQIDGRVLRAVNELLSENMDPSTGHVVVTQAELTERFVSFGVSEVEALDNDWLNFEARYAWKGWRVQFLPRLGEREPQWRFVPVVPFQDFVR